MDRSRANGIPALCLVDTGFNGTLLCGEEVAGDLDMIGRGVFRTYQTAGGPIRVEDSDAEIQWFGEVVHIRALVELGVKRPLRGEPEALLGTLQINPDTLLIEFFDGDVFIKER